MVEGFFWAKGMGSVLLSPVLGLVALQEAEGLVHTEQ